MTPCARKQRLDELRREHSPTGEQWREALDILSTTLDQEERLVQKLHRIRTAVVELDERLRTVENSIVFRALRGIGRGWTDLRGRAGQALLRSPLHRTYARLQGPGSPAILAEIDGRQLEELRRNADAWTHQPLISIVIPVYRPRKEWLEAAIESVRNQVYERWQICLCIDGEDSVLARDLSEHYATDERIRIASLPQKGGISAALNAAFAIADGAYCGFLDQDDLLAPTALHRVAAALQSGDADVLYTDEDVVTADGGRARLNLKPSWSPELLLSCMYMGHLLIVSKAALENVGPFRPEFDGAQDYDLALRLDEAGAVFRHIPEVLYHWRMHDGSTAASAGAKPYAHEAGRRALAASLERRGARSAVVLDGPIPHTYRVRRPAPECGISFVIVSRNARLLERCLQSVDRTAGGLLREYIVVRHLIGSRDARMDAVLEQYRCVVETYDGPFDFALMNNLGSRRAQYPVLLLLNDDVTALEAGWAEAMLAQVVRPEIGVVGAKLVYRAGSIQHAGIVTGMGEASGHAGRGEFRSDLWPWLDLTRDVNAVTGACMAVRREVFEQLGGFDGRFPVNYNDVDFCLRARKAGYRVLIETAAVLRHDECRTRVPGTSFAEREQFLDVWEHKLEDPFYSPALRRKDESIALT